MPGLFSLTNLLHPTPAPPAFGKGKFVPDGEGGATLLSRLTLHWLGPFLDVGFSRPLMEDDFWSLPHARQTDVLTQSLERVFYGRCAPSKRPFHLREAGQEHLRDSNEQSPEEVEGSKEKAKINVNPKTEEITDLEDRQSDSMKCDESLFKSLFLAFKHRIIWSCMLLLVSDTLRTTTPLVTKVFLTWLIEVYVYHILSLSPTSSAAVGFTGPPQGVGYGIGLAFAIFGMQVCASLLGNHFNLAAMTTAQSTRTALTGLIFRKSLRLQSGRAGVADQKNEKEKEEQGQQPEVTTLIAVDVTRLDAFVGFGAHLVSAPIQLILGIGLLIGNLGYSTLAGLGVIFLTSPIQLLLVKALLSQQRKAVNITDQRVRLTTEVLQGIRLIKAFGWEAFWEHRIGGVRQREVKKIKVASIAAALLVAMFTFTPVMAIILTFITYSLTGHDLDIATIFTSLQLFNNIRIPLMLFPMVLSSLTDALISLARISKFLTAEEVEEPHKIDEGMECAVQVVGGEFEWELHAGKDRVGEEKKETKKGQSWWRKRKTSIEELPTAVTMTAESHSSEGVRNREERPFKLQDLHMYVPKGGLVVIIGPVGSGKSSILQALIGQMKRVKGEVTFGGPIAYVPQVPWIKNATVRDNVLFGSEYEEDRFQEVIRTCCLERDLAVLLNGEHTEIGEKGVNLSGGQKARVSLARAAYSRSTIVLLDDPLSAVDAYVGKYILENCLLDGPLANRTRILVTHALHVLDKADYIYVMDNGKITGQGTFPDLMATSITFRRLLDEHARSRDQNAPKHGPDCERGVVDDGSVSSGGRPGKLQDTAAALMEVEERNTGAVGWDVYTKYLRNAGGLFWIPVIGTLLAVSEAGNVAVTLFLGFWTGKTIPHFKNGHYMAIYAAIGGSMAIVTFLQTYAFITLCLSAGLNLYKGALAGVLRSPVSFFDTTPMGRISARLTKDQSAIDNQLPFALLQFFSIFVSVFGTIGLVFYAFPYLGILFIPLTILYYGASVFYRRSSVEAKRLDSILRSYLYASYSETLTGLSTIRAYSKQASSIADVEKKLDMNNRAYYMTIVMQRWLAIRLDFFGNVLVLGIALFGAAASKTVNPAKTSVALTYTLGITQIFAEIVSLFANCEQEMNAVERLLHYKELVSEGNPSLEAVPPSSWPSDGRIEFSNVKMSYREGLPVVLKGVSFSIRSGEKIGIVGRTGSGKSSLIQVLLRLVELQDGKIEVDGYDILQVSLTTLRSRMAFVPQDTNLFLGTLRDNLDPQRTRTDAELISVLQRVWLLPKDNNSIAPTNETKFDLDTIVGDEGSNYSAGEKQLLALGRALVKNSRIVILDEATSSVDAETDAKVQRTIRSELASSTLICIAHRLNTIAHYDRILVMDDGHIVEFDPALNLYDRPESVFRSLCVEANLTRADILKIRAEH